MKAFRFFKHLTGLLLLNVLVKPLWIFGVDRQVQNQVGHEAYGTYFSLFSLTLIFSFLTDAGLSNMVNRKLAAGARFSIHQLLRLKAALALGYAALVLVTAALTGVQQWNFLLPLLLIQILLSFSVFLRGLITAHQLFGAGRWLSVIDRLLLLVLFLPLLYLPFFKIPITVPFFLQAQLVCMAVTTALAAAVAVKHGLLQANGERQQSMGILKSMAPFALIILAMSVHSRLGGFLLERVHGNGAYEAGVYASAYRLLEAVNMVGFLVASYLVPFLARHASEPKLLQQTVSTAHVGLLLFGIFTAWLVVAFARDVQAVLYSTASGYTVQILQGCLPALPAYLSLHVYGSLLTALGHLRLFLVLLAVAVAINGVLNILLIPRFGALGCCVAALTSQYLCAISVYFFTVRKAGLQHDGRGLLRVVLTTIVLGSLFIIGQQGASPPFWLLAAGSGVTGLALFTYLPFFKRPFILLR